MVRRDPGDPRRRRPDLAMNIRDLSAIYLGGTPLAALGPGWPGHRANERRCGGDGGCICVVPATLLS